MKLAYNSKREETFLIPPKFLEKKKEKFQRTNKNPIASRGTGV